MGELIILKHRKKFCILHSIIFFLFMGINIIGAFAQTKETYIGIDEDDVFIWSISYDEDAIEDWYDDANINITIFDFDEDIEAVKLYIIKIGEEKEYLNHDGVKITYNYYETEDRSAENWELEDEGADDIVYEYSSNNVILDYYQDCAFWGSYIVANNVNWQFVIAEFNQHLGSDGTASVSGNSITIVLYDYNRYIGNNSYSFEDVRINCEYTDDGVLKTYRFQYDDETLIELTLEEWTFSNIWIFIVIGIIALIGIGIIIIIIKSSSKKTEKEIKKIEVKKEEEIQELKPEELKDQGKPLFCPYCGSPYPIEAKFCEFCGKNLND